MDVKSISQQENSKKPTWNTCNFCKNTHFKDLHEFSRHLRLEHCTVEGGSFVCRYGYNAVCNSLPLEGVSDLDYAEHIIKQHAFRFLPNLRMADGDEVKRRPSTSSVSSISSSSNTLWTISSASQNLAAVLNDPGRGKQRDFFTKTWGTEFSENYSIAPEPHPQLPVINRSHFENYLKKIAKRHKRHTEISLTNDITQKSQSLSTIRDPLDIPPIFLHTDFNLSKPEVFFNLFPSARDEPFNEWNHEKLTACLDQVEMRIAEQVAQKSEAFFQAMTSHDSLMEQLSRILVVVGNLRSKLRFVDYNTSADALRLLKLHRRRANNALVLQKLKLMNTVHATQPQIQLLLAAPDYVAALELSSTTRGILDNELQGVLCFRHLGPQLSEMDRLIDKMMACEFETYSTRDLNRPLTDNPGVLEQDKLVSIMLGMLRRGNLEFIRRYEGEAMTAIRALVKQLALEKLAESDENDCEQQQQQRQGPYLADQAALLPLSALVPLIYNVMGNLVKLLKKIKGVHDVILETFHAASGTSKATSSQFAFLPTKDFQKGVSDLRKLLEAVCNFAHEECSKLLSNADALNDASANEVCHLGNIVAEFHAQSRDICNCSATPLQFAFRNQAGNFVKRFHSERKEKLWQQLENECWRAVTDIPQKFQLWFDEITKNGVIANLEDFEEENYTSCLIINGEKYNPIVSVLTLLRLISEYAEMARHLPLLVNKVARNLEEILNLFNSRSCLLVLGAGAVKKETKDGRKTITSTNLALTSRNLQLLLWMLPAIRQHFEGLASQENNGKIVQSNGFLLQLENNMDDHIAKLQTKVVFIVNSTIRSEIKSWNAKPPVPSQAIRNVLKYLTKLYEAVVDVLPASQIELLYKEIHESFKCSLRDQVKALNIINDGGPQHGAVTTELLFYAKMLKELNVLPLEDLNENSLCDIWNPR